MQTQQSRSMQMCQFIDQLINLRWKITRILSQVSLLENFDFPSVNSYKIQSRVGLNLFVYLTQSPVYCCVDSWIPADVACRDNNHTSQLKLIDSKTYITSDSPVFPLFFFLQHLIGLLYNRSMTSSCNGFLTQLLNEPTDQSTTGPWPEPPLEDY